MQNIPLSQLPIAPRLNGFTCQKKVIIISQKLQEDVHKYRPGEDHYAHLIMGSHFDKYSEFYHLRIYVPQNRKDLQFTKQCVPWNEDWNHTIRVNNFSTMEQNQDVGSKSSYLQKFLIHLHRQDVYWLETTFHPQRRRVFCYSLFWQNRIPLFYQVPWRHIMYWYTDTAYKNRATGCTSLLIAQTT